MIDPLSIQDHHNHNIVHLKNDRRHKMDQTKLTIDGINATSPADPIARELKRILKSIARTYNCSLQNFDVDNGKVTFQFDSEKLTNDMIEYITTVTAT